jgi:hypothetical protein
MSQSETSNKTTAGRTIGMPLEKDWYVGPNDPKTGKETDFKYLSYEAEWDDAMFAAAAQCLEGNATARPVDDPYALAMQEQVMAEDERGGEKPMTKIMLNRAFWSSAVIPGSPGCPELGRVHYSWPHQTDVEVKHSPAYIVVMRDAVITPP